LSVVISGLSVRSVPVIPSAAWWYAAGRRSLVQDVARARRVSGSGAEERVLRSNQTIFA
jgi:hypothetical protein